MSHHISSKSKTTVMHVDTQPIVLASCEHGIILHYIFNLQVHHNEACGFLSHLVELDFLAALSAKIVHLHETSGNLLILCTEELEIYGRMKH
eukprot:4343801-Pleurochrysis_carterae.AAC.5